MEATTLRIRRISATNTNSNPENQEDLFCENFVKRMLFQWVTEVELGDVQDRGMGGGGGGGPRSKFESLKDPPLVCPSYPLSNTKRPRPYSAELEILGTSE